MPPVGEQMTHPGSRTNPALTAARFLLKPGRKYEEAVKAFEPYDRVQEVNSEARAAGRKLIAEGKAASFAIAATVSRAFPSSLLLTYQPHRNESKTHFRLGLRMSNPLRQTCGHETDSSVRFGLE